MNAESPISVPPHLFLPNFRHYINQGIVYDVARGLSRRGQCDLRFPKLICSPSGSWEIQVKYHHADASGYGHGNNGNLSATFLRQRNQDTAVDYVSQTMIRRHIDRTVDLHAYLSAFRKQIHRAPIQDRCQTYRPLNSYLPNPWL